jgi:hypothetical protein
MSNSMIRRLSYFGGSWLPNLAGNALKMLRCRADELGVEFVNGDFVDLSTNQASIGGNKTFTGTVTLTAPAITTLVIENRTTDPTSPVSGQMWLRTNL